MEVCLSTYDSSLSHHCVHINRNYKKLIRDEIANVNFLYDDIVHALQNTILVHRFRHRSTQLCDGKQVYQSQ